MRVLDHFDCFDTDAATATALVPHRCRRHPRSATFRRDPDDFDGIADDLTHNLNALVAGVLLCPRCLGGGEGRYLDILVGARRALRAAGIAMPLTEWERKALALAE